MKPSSDINRAARALTHAIAAQPDDFEHPGYERLEAYVDGLADAVDSEVVEAHLEWCATCAQDVADLWSIAGGVEWKDASGVVAGKSASGVVGRKDASGVVERKDTSGVAGRRWLQVAAAVMVLAGLGYFVIGQQRASEPSETNQIVQAPPPIQPSPSDQSNAPAQTNSLNSDEQALVSRVLSARALELPSTVRGLSRPVGTLLGGGASSSSLLPLSPIGTAVLSTTPEFTWQPMRGATSYSIAVFDQRFTEVAGATDITGSSWTPSTPLPRGATLAWQITAHFPSGDVLAPAPPQPEARFVVVDSATATTVESQRARLATQPLALGILLAKAGLFADAERELKRAADQPESADRAKELLAGLKR